MNISAVLSQIATNQSNPSVLPDTLAQSRVSLGQIQNELRPLVDVARGELNPGLPSLGSSNADAINRAIGQIGQAIELIGATPLTVSDAPRIARGAAFLVSGAKVDLESVTGFRGGRLPL